MRNIKIDESYLTSIGPLTGSDASGFLPEQISNLLDSWALRARTSNNCSRCGSKLEQTMATLCARPRASAAVHSATTVAHCRRPIE
jgi:hypothetical protein